MINFIKGLFGYESEQDQGIKQMYEDVKKMATPIVDHDNPDEMYSRAWFDHHNNACAKEENANCYGEVDAKFDSDRARWRLEYSIELRDQLIEKLESLVEALHGDYFEIQSMEQDEEIYSINKEIESIKKLMEIESIKKLMENDDE